RQQRGGHARRLPDADGGHVRADELHGVVDRQSGGDRAARAVDVQRDVLLWILGLQEQQLRRHQIRHVVVDRGSDEDDVVAQQPRIDVVGTLAARGLFDHHGDQAHAEALSSLAACGIAPPVADSSRNSSTRAWRSLPLILPTPPLSVNRARTCSIASCRPRAIAAISASTASGVASICSRSAIFSSSSEVRTCSRAASSWLARTLPQSSLSLRGSMPCSAKPISRRSTRASTCWSTMPSGTSKGFCLSSSAINASSA